MKKLTSTPLFTFAICGILFASSCKKSNDTENLRFSIPQECKDNIQDNEGVVTGGAMYVFDKTCMSGAQFNPNNPAELLYYNKFEKIIYIYDRRTGQKRNLASCQNPPHLKWGRNDHILVGDGLIHTIKSNGDSVKDYFGGYDPEWNWAGDKFIYAANIPRSTYMVYDFYTGDIDTLPMMLGSGLTWQNRQNKVVYYAIHDPVPHSFLLTDMTNLTTESIMEIESPGWPCWINDDEFLYTESWQLFSYKIKTGKKEKLAQHCRMDQLGYMSYSPSTNELVTTFSHYAPEGNNAERISSRIMILNFNDNSVSFIDP